MRQLLSIATAGLLTMFINWGTGDFQPWSFNSEAGTYFVSVKDFGAKGDLRTCRDVRVSKGSVILFSPSQCNFSASDVGKWVQVPRAGDSFGTGLSAQISSITDSRHALVSVAAAATVDTAEALRYNDLQLLTPDTGSATSLWVASITQPFSPTQIGSTLTITGGTGFTAGTYNIESVDYNGRAVLSANAGTSGSTSGTGTTSIATTIGTGNATALQSAAGWLCAHPYTNLVFPPGAYYVEKYWIKGGPNANNVGAVTYYNCSNVAVTGYGASIHSNGAFRQLKDNSGSSWEQSVTPFWLATAYNMVIAGFELNGHSEMMTQVAGNAENQSYGLIDTGGSQNLTLRDLNIHNWPTDGVYLGFTGAGGSENLMLDNIWSHNNARQGMTLGAINGLNAHNFECSEIGTQFTGGYGGHNPQACVDMEPGILVGTTGLTNILFDGGYMAYANQNLFDMSANTVGNFEARGITFDCSGLSACAAGIGSFDTAQSSFIHNNTFIQGVVSCYHYASSWTQNSDYVANKFILTSMNQLNCGGNDGTIRPKRLIDNEIWVGSNATSQNVTFYLDHIQEVRGNRFFISKNAYYANNAGVNYTDTMTVADNTYATDLTTSNEHFAVTYTNVRYWRNEKSLNPVYFTVASANGGGGDMTFAGNLSVSAPATPSAPTVSCVGSCGSGSYSYVMVARVGSSGLTAASSAGSARHGPTTFSSSSYNAIMGVWLTGANEYDFYCTAGCLTLGKVNPEPVGVPYFHDTKGVGDGTTPPARPAGLGMVTIGGGMRLIGGAPPTCDAVHRGTFWYVPGGTGVKDAVNVCAKDGAGIYEWRVLY